MRRLISEIVNGAMFAALVVLASGIPRAAPQVHVGTAAPSAANSDANSDREHAAARTESFAAVGARASFAPFTETQSDLEPKGELVEAVAKAGSIVVPKPLNAEPSRPIVDAHVPPIRRQRPATPPLAFAATADKAAKGKSRSGAKTQVKKAARKGQEASRSSLGAASRVKAARNAE